MGLSHKSTLVTANIKEFRRIQGRNFSAPPIHGFLSMG